MATTCFAYSLNSGSAASLRETAIAAMVYIERNESNRIESEQSNVKKRGLIAYIIVWATLACGEHGLVNTILHIRGVFAILFKEYQARARPTKSLVAKDKKKKHHALRMSPKEKESILT